MESKQQSEKVKVLDADWSADADSLSDWGWVHFHQGGRYDSTTKLYAFRHRDYSPTLQRWMQEDPMGYVDGMNLYQYVRGNPIGSIDPLGLATLIVDLDFDWDSKDDWNSFHAKTAAEIRAALIAGAHEGDVAGTELTIGDLKTNAAYRVIDDECTCSDGTQGKRIIIDTITVTGLAARGFMLQAA
jgi:RHS repeat-associated protein